MKESPTGQYYRIRPSQTAVPEPLKVKLARAKELARFDPQVAAALLADMPETTAAGYKDLADALAKHGAERGDAEWLIGLVEEYVESKEVDRA